MKLIDAAKLTFAILLCQSAGWVGSLFTAPSIPEWYAQLNKPFFTPPSWVFAPVWITLFTFMGIAAFLIWKKGLKERTVRWGLILFLAQLVLNSLWSFLFFGLRSPFYALLEIFVLWTAILITILQFLKISRWAALLLLPYLVWVSLACSLNLGIFLLNR